jgi:hypothetical protein
VRSEGVNIAVTFLRAEFPVEFLLLLVFVAVVAALVFFALLIGAELERRQREKGRRSG